MISVKDTDFFKDVLKVYNYTLGDIYVFEVFVVSECHLGGTVGWDNYTKKMVEDVTAFYGTDGSNVIYISNRIHSYSVVASDWIHFFKTNYAIKAYFIVSENKAGFLNSMIEKLFFKNKITHFTNLYEAVNFVKKGLVEIS